MWNLWALLRRNTKKRFSCKPVSNWQKNYRVVVKIQAHKFRLKSGTLFVHAFLALFAAFSFLLIFNIFVTPQSVSHQSIQPQAVILDIVRYY